MPFSPSTQRSAICTALKHRQTTSRSFWSPSNLLWHTYSAAHNLQGHYTFADGKKRILTMIPWSKIPTVKEIAPEFYEPLTAHYSWFKTFWDFVWDPKITLSPHRSRSIKGPKNDTQYRTPTWTTELPDQSVKVSVAMVHTILPLQWPSIQRKVAKSGKNASIPRQQEESDMCKLVTSGSVVTKARHSSLRFWKSSQFGS
ncbi:hypothetical protein BJ742DRAFT_734233 [Cladochytrium replicatum]|nr:hypothetical protein BJ742DRAFT_734233 [Cladochytrium replicatum]